MAKVVLYTINCPKCKVLEKKLQQKEITFDVVDDKEEVVRKGTEIGIKSAPFLIIDDKPYNFNNALNWVGEQQNGHIN